MTNEPERTDPGIPTLTEVLAPGEAAPSPPGQTSAATSAPEQGVPADVAVFAERVSARLTLQLADEITTMLDARSQAAIWEALLAQIAERQLGLVSITHHRVLAERTCTHLVEFVGLSAHLARPTTP